MPSKGSRYANSVFFRYGEGDEVFFRGLRPRQIATATPVLEYTIKQGDRLDLLSLYFYNNDRYWWRIVDANPDIVFAGDLSLETFVGETILIPALKERGAG